MPIAISLLRGINVGGHNKIGMEALRALYESLSLRDPQTYIQSGNVVFRTNMRHLDRLPDRIETAIERSFGVRPRVIIRTPSELREIVARNPCADRPGCDPAKLLVAFLAADPGPELRAKVRALTIAPEELWVANRELYAYFPNGMARPALSMAAIERLLKIPGTGRNWNTVLKLLEIAERYNVKIRDS